MSIDDATSRARRRKKETTVREAVVGRVRLCCELYGLETAMKEFDEMKVKLSDLTPEWSEIAAEVHDFFKETRKQAQEAAVEREQQMTQAWAEGLSKGVVANQLNLMPGSNQQAPYYSSTPTMTGGIKK